MQPLEGTHSAPRILIVENDADHAVLLHRILNEYSDPVTKTKYEIGIATDIASARSYLERDCIDIYLVDLIMVQDKMTPHNQENKSVGIEFIRDIVGQSNAGVIVHSSIPPERESPQLLELGADDYIWKYPQVWDESIPNIVRARVNALWRRIQLSRPRANHLYAHTNRTFLVGDWRFVVGNRTLHKTTGEAIRLSATEHALLRYACVIEGNEVDADRFSSDALHKDSSAPFRLDNLVHRVKSKLGNSVEWLSLGDRTYKLVGIQELRATGR